MTAVIARSQISEPERWSVSGGSVSRRLESWSEILATTHLAFDITPRTRRRRGSRASSADIRSTT